MSDAMITVRVQIKYDTDESAICANDEEDVTGLEWSITAELTNIFLFLFFPPLVIRFPSIFRLLFHSLTRCDDNVEFFHYVQRFPKYTTGRVQFNGDERVGRRLYVFYLRVPPRIRLRQLCGSQAAAAQRGLPTRREPSDSGKFHYSDTPQQNTTQISPQTRNN